MDAIRDPGPARGAPAMSSALGPAVLGLYYLILAVLAFFGVPRLWVVLLYLKTRRRNPVRPPDPELWPLVTVQLPLYNEMYVATRLIDAVCCLDYPRDRLEIQVLDDSTDETTAIVQRLGAGPPALGLDINLGGHFWMDDMAGNRSNCFFNFNGTAGVWRRAAIAGGGGWEHDTLTEDLDLSYRAQLIGWRFLYLPELAVPSELPVDVNGFKTQQYRWAKGAIQTGRKLIGRVLGSPLPPRVKFEAFVHLTNNISYPLMLLLSLLIFPAMLLRRGTAMRWLAIVDFPFFLSATASVLVFYLMSQVAGGSGWRRQLRYLPALVVMGHGLSVVYCHPEPSGLVQRGGIFHRTPKYRIESSGQDW